MHGFSQTVNRTEDSVMVAPRDTDCQPSDHNQEVFPASCRLSIPDSGPMGRDGQSKICQNGLPTSDHGPQLLGIISDDDSMEIDDSVGNIDIQAVYKSRHD